MKYTLKSNKLVIKIHCRTKTLVIVLLRHRLFSFFNNGSSRLIMNKCDKIFLRNLFITIFNLLPSLTQALNLYQSISIYLSLHVFPSLCDTHNIYLLFYMRFVFVPIFFFSCPALALFH